MLDDDGVGLLDTIRRHVAALERDIEQRRRLLDRLHQMLGTLERSAAPTLDDLLGTVEAMTVVEATIEDVITRDPWEAAFEMRRTSCAEGDRRRAGFGAISSVPRDRVRGPAGARVPAGRSSPSRPRDLGDGSSGAPC